MPQNLINTTRGSIGGPAGGHVPAPASRGRPAVDALLRDRFRDGDPDAVRAVYRTYGRLAYATARAILTDPGLCEEATQRTFLKAWRAASSIDPEQDLAPWLVTIAKRVAIDIYRREIRRAANALEAVPADHPALISPAISVEDVYERREVRRAVSLLPDDEREIVRAQHFDGLTHAQIATRLGISVGTVKSRSFRAHRRLAVELGHLRQDDACGAAGRALSRGSAPSSPATRSCHRILTSPRASQRAAIPPIERHREHHPEHDVVGKLGQQREGADRRE